MTGLIMQIWFTSNLPLILGFLTDLDRLFAAWLPQWLGGNHALREANVLKRGTRHFMGSEDVDD
jgi:hypothetical protein